MKTMLTVLLIFSSFCSFSQAPDYSKTPDYQGRVKSVITYNYIPDETNTEVIQNTLHPTCEVCEHFEKFDRKGQLVEKQEYIIFEPVSDLEMGYCLHLDLEYRKGELILITAKEFEQHGMWDEKNDFENSEGKTVYSFVKKGKLAIASYGSDLDEVHEKHYQNGLLIKDKYSNYEYNDNGQKTKSTSIGEDVTGSIKTEIWTYNNDLLETYKYTSVSSNFFGTLDEYTYYNSGELFSKKAFSLSGPEVTDERELRSINYYYRDGRDSLFHYTNLYSSTKAERNYFYTYEFHPNGTISSKTQLTEFGDISEFDTFDDRGNLTQHNSFNMSLEVSQVDKYTYNEKNQLIELNVVNNYHDEEYTILYTFDENGNQTHTYRESDGEIVLLQRKVFEYY